MVEIDNQFIAYVKIPLKDIKQLIKSKAKKKYIIAVEIVNG
jgi:hypothetical protein